MLLILPSLIAFRVRYRTPHSAVRTPARAGRTPRRLPSHAHKATVANTTCHVAAHLCSSACAEHKSKAATQRVWRDRQTTQNTSLEHSQLRFLCHMVARSTRSLASSTRTPRARIHATIGARRSMTPPGRRPLNDCLRTARN